jgi:integrase
MPREATGELRQLADGYAARVTIVGRQRQDFFLPTCPTESEALARCKALASMAARLRKAGKSAEIIIPYLEQGAKARTGRAWDFVVGAVDLEVGGRAKERAGGEIPNFEQWASQWTSGALARKYPDHVKAKRSADRDEDLLRLYVLPHVRHVRVDEFTLEDAELVMASMPKNDPRPHRAHLPLKTGTRRHVAQTMVRLMNLAVYPGKYRQASPIPRGWLPSPDEAVAKECLYPDEETLLLGGKSVQENHWGSMKDDVPLLRRMAYGFLTREGMRTDEMGSLQWSDVDLKHGRVVLDENKTDDPRDWDLQPDVVEALARWKQLQADNAEPDDYVFAENGHRIHVEHLADRLRFDLLRVGVTRPQLFEHKHEGVRRLALRAHDLRATFVTIGLATDRSRDWISDRTGHKSDAMIDNYRRKARTWNLGPLGPMHEAIPELASVERIPHGLPHAAQIAENSQRAQRKPMP